MVSSVVMSGTGKGGSVISAGGILIWAVLYSFGEVFHSTSEFLCSFDLADQDRIGEYQGVFSLFKGVSNAAAPAVLTLVVLNGRMLGWLIMGFLLLAACLILIRYIFSHYDMTATD